MKLSEIDPDLFASVMPYTLSCSAEPMAGPAESHCWPSSLAPCPAHFLVIAYGNTLRRDDGAGIGLAGILVKQWRILGIGVRYIVVPQLAPELAVDIADPGVMGVIFVDAAQAEPPLMIKLQAIALDLATPVVSHHLDPAGLLLYARLLAPRSVPAWTVSVPGVDFDYGEGFSPLVRQLFHDAPQLALEFLARIRERIREQVQYA